MKAGGLLHTALDLLFPPRCLICSEVVPLKETLCAGCMGILRRESAAECCSVCGKPPKSCVCSRTKEAFVFSRCRSAFRYTAERRALIETLKHDRRRPTAKPLAALMAEMLDDIEFDWVTEVPMPEAEIQRRGHNQARTLALEISRLIGVPYRETPLLRLEETRTQHTLSADERAENAKNSYVRKQDGVIGGRVLLVDDVATTCSTLNRCAGLLLQCGADEVACLTAATTLLQKEAEPDS